MIETSIDNWNSQNYDEAKTCRTDNYPMKGLMCWAGPSCACKRVTDKETKLPPAASTPRPIPGNNKKVTS